MRRDLKIDRGVCSPEGPEVARGPMSMPSLWPTSLVKCSGVAGGTQLCNPWSAVNSGFWSQEALGPVQ